MTFAAFWCFFDSPNEVDDGDNEFAMVLFGYGKYKQYFNCSEYSKHWMKDWKLSFM